MIKHFLSECKKTLLFRKLQPDVSEHLRACKSALQQNDLETADIFCKKILGRTPAHAEGLYYQGVVYIRQGNTVEAIDYLEQSYKINPTSEEVGFTLGALLANDNPYQAYSQYIETLCNTYKLKNKQNISDVYLVLVKSILSGETSFLTQNTAHIKNIGIFIAKYHHNLDRNNIYKSIINFFNEHPRLQHTGIILPLLLMLLGFQKDTEHQWKKDTFTKLVWPLIQYFLLVKEHNYAFYLEAHSYNEYIKQNEKETTFRESFELINPLFKKAGKEASITFDNADFNYTKKQKIYKIALFFHSPSTLAHVELVLNTLEGYRKCNRNTVKFKVFVLLGYDPKMEKCFSDLGIQIEWLDKHTIVKNDIYELLTNLRKIIVKEEITAIIWISVVIYMEFCFSMRMAPVQIWWAMKYHSIESGNIDGYVASYSITKYKKIGGRTWRTARHGINNWYDPSLENEAQQLRSERYNRYKIILGSLGREEKLNNVDFINSVCDVLQANTESCFLWTGRQQLASIQNIFHQRNVSDRSFYIGWVNTKLYAQVIDVFLDSYPFPCGFTVFQTMAAAKPVVFYASEEAYESGVYGLLSPVLEGQQGNKDDINQIKEIFSFSIDNKSLFPVAKTNDEYVTLANQIITNQNLRIKIGAANKKFVDEQMSSPEKMAEEFLEHVEEIIQEKTNVS